MCVREERERERALTTHSFSSYVWMNGNVESVRLCLITVSVCVRERQCERANI